MYIKASECLHSGAFLKCARVGLEEIKVLRGGLFQNLASEGHVWNKLA